VGRCPDCGNWNTFSETAFNAKAGSAYSAAKGSSGGAPESLKNVVALKAGRVNTGIPEFDRIIGGGLVPGAMVLLAGPPGIGKSTLLLQIAESMAKSGKTCLYVSGEESVQQLKLRGNRLNAGSEKLLVYSETSVSEIILQIKKIKPDLTIIDSIQTLHNPELPAISGSVGQVRECAEEINHAAKTMHVPVIVSGQVTKEGAIAGPKVLEHTVDTVLYFDEAKDNFHRIIRTEKNRFGPSDELGIFQMKVTGLEEVINPSAMFLESRPADATGSVIVSLMNGSRPLLLELQALITRTNFNLPRRQVSGLDYNRVLLLVAVMERILKLDLQGWDIFLNIAGGTRVNEPACDLSIIMAVYSAYRNMPVGNDTVVIGEVGLSGEIRAVSYMEKRVAEAEKLGFKTCIIPRANLKNLSAGRTDLIGVAKLKEAMEVIDARWK